jgi:hypothetical protein
LLDFNTAITNSILKWLSLPVELKFTQTFISDYDKDYRIYDFDFKTEVATYIQVFPSENSCNSDLSILDLLFCEGPLARNWIIS